MIKVFLSFFVLFLFSSTQLYSMPLLTGKVSGVSSNKITEPQKQQTVSSGGSSGGSVSISKNDKLTYVGSVNLDGISNTTSSASSNNPLANWDFLQCDSDAYKFCNNEYKNVISNCGITNCSFASEDGTESSLKISSINANVSVITGSTKSAVCAYYSDVDINLSSNPKGVLTLIRSGVSSRASSVVPAVTNLELCYNAIDSVSECLIENLESLSVICSSIITDSPCWAESEINVSDLQLESYDE